MLDEKRDDEMNRPRFDWTFNFGHLVMAGTMLFSFGGFYVLTDYRLSAVERQVDRLGTVVLQSVRLEERYESLLGRVERLERR